MMAPISHLFSGMAGVLNSHHWSSIITGFLTLCPKETDSQSL